MFFVMMDHEQTVASANSLDDARLEGQRLCDAEFLPAVFSIYDEDVLVENIERSDKRSLGDQISDFNCADIPLIPLTSRAGNFFCLRATFEASRSGIVADHLNGKLACEPDVCVDHLHLAWRIAIFGSLIRRFAPFEHLQGHKFFPL